MMLDQTISLVRDYPRSIGIISALQFGIYFVCNGMLLFFPDILNQTAKFMQSSSNHEIKLCDIVQNAIEARKNPSNSLEKICVEELDITAYYYAIILEGCYTVGFLIVSLLVNYVGRLTIFSVVFFSTGIAGFLMVMTSNPIVATYLYVWLLVSGVNNTLLNTVTYDLFPTNLRSLAMSFSLMFGRLASLGEWVSSVGLRLLIAYVSLTVGGNIAGLLLDGHCTTMFIISGVVLVFCGILTFFIPNIMKKK